MNDFTYEVEESLQTLEYYEWDNLWYENPADKKADRVLVIGDSISCGYRRIISDIADGKYLVDGIGSSKAVDNTGFTKMIDYVVTQTPTPKVVLINNGLHGWHLNAEQYEKSYKDIAEYIVNKFAEAKFVMVTTTPTRNTEDLMQYDENRYNRIIERNNIALKISEKFNMTVCDLFAVVENHPEFYCDDGVHMKEDGYKLLAKHCNDVISGLI